MQKYFLIAPVLLLPFLAQASPTHMTADEKGKSVKEELDLTLDDLERAIKGAHKKVEPEIEKLLDEVEESVKRLRGKLKESPKKN